MAELTGDRLVIPAKILSQAVQHAQSLTPREACGLLAGSSFYAAQIFQITNISPDSAAFYLEPAELIAAFYEIESQGLEIVAFYHSHPFSPPHPSRADIDQYYYPEIPHMIIGRQDNIWVAKAYTIRSGHWVRLPIHTPGE